MKMAKGALMRIRDILKSNINEMLDRAEEPDKMIRQMIRDMEEAVNKATASVGTAVANQKRLERQFNDKKSQVDEWQRKAERAVETGADDLARRALERKAMFAKVADDLAPVLEESLQTAEQLRGQLRELKTKLEEARTRQGALVARHQAAEARKRLAQSISGLGKDAFSSFERFEQKVEESEAEASAHAEISGEMDNIEKEIHQIDIDSSVNDELQALKEKLKKSE
jgi:phage shock protein A